MIAKVTRIAYGTLRVGGRVKKQRIVGYIENAGQLVGDDDNGRALAVAQAENEIV